MIEYIHPFHFRDLQSVLSEPFNREYRELTTEEKTFVLRSMKMILKYSTSIADAYLLARTLTDYLIDNVGSEMTVSRQISFRQSWFMDKLGVRVDE